ncbi:MAG: RecQ family ATP-dependent DNA helicase [Spirochaetaceae bacterium]|jgi:ATP-dependent DNA helicase RecQ|nr:RecQ family ATP-dependent DNA helicase [Spirochaetaceae bacterium]
MHFINDSIAISDPINELAKCHFNIDYVFPYQRLVISNILRNASIKGFEVNEDLKEELSPHQIVLLPTGAGKSLCFMLPAIVLEGITLIIFPLLSLMSDQQRRTDQANIKSVIIRGGQNSIERKEIYEKCRSGGIKIILTNPETILSEDVLSNIKNITISHLVIDETHTVSEWGETFRPAYLDLYKIIYQLNIQQITAFTATASPHILNKIKQIIFPDSFPNIIYGNPDRNNIFYSVIKSDSPMKHLLDLVREEKKPLIIFSSSRTGCEITSRMLRRNLPDDNIFFYHAGLSKEEKREVESWFFESDKGILIATCAYGMGVDKSDIRTVIHINLPLTVESYLQESGRGGRDREPSKAILIYSENELNRLSKLSTPLSRDRFKSMINYATDNKNCRRENLLALLGSEPEICSGCDVCRETIFFDDTENGLYNILKRNKRRFTKHVLLYFLKGYHSNEIRDQLLYKINGFGILRNWNIDFILELIENKITYGYLQIIKRGLWKNKITLSKKKK